MEPEEDADIPAQEVAQRYVLTSLLLEAIW